MAPYDAPTETRHTRLSANSTRRSRMALNDVFEKFGAEKVFHQAGSRTRQRSDICQESSAVKPFRSKICRRQSSQSVRSWNRGEGAVIPTHPLRFPEDPSGTYDYYGLRIDRTYGPILGTPFELFPLFQVQANSRFKEIPRYLSDHIESPGRGYKKRGSAKKLAVTFNKYCSIILKSMELSFFGAAK